MAQRQRQYSKSIVLNPSTSNRHDATLTFILSHIANILEAPPHLPLGEVSGFLAAKRCSVNKLMSWLLTVTAIWSLLRLKTTLTRAARVEKNGKASQCKNQNAELKRAKMLRRAEGSCGEAVKSHSVASLLLVTGHIIHIQCCDCRQKKQLLPQDVHGAEK